MKAIDLLIVTLVAFFLAIAVESALFILQYKFRWLTLLCGDKDFRWHAGITLSFWILAGILLVILQFFAQPRFHQNAALQYSGGIMLLLGLALSVSGFRILGLRQSLGLNFYRQDIPRCEHRLFRIVKHPMDFGLWFMLFGWALLSRATFNLVVALFVMLLMIPHIRIEQLAVPRE